MIFFLFPLTIVRSLDFYISSDPCLNLDLRFYRDIAPLMKGMQVLSAMSFEKLDEAQRTTLRETIIASSIYRIYNGFISLTDS